MGCTQASNPVAITIEPNSIIHVVCVAHAAFFQQVTLSFNADMSSPLGTFSGSGENVPMALAGGSTILTQSTGNSSVIYANFAYSSSGSGGPFTQASVCNPVVSGTAPNPVITTVTSEDYYDNDDNDSYLTIIDLNA